VVEDVATQRQLLLDYRDKQNFRVSGADGVPALGRLVERELPALVLLDVGLPGEEVSRWRDRARGGLYVRSAEGLELTTQSEAAVVKQMSSHHCRK
jgi:DNA-binding response OmpR family regulator